MRIHSYRVSREEGSATASATVTWEDNDRPEREIYVATTERFGADLWCNPNAFLLGAFMPAMHHGERRVRVEGKLCPQLRNGLNTAVQVLRRWYGEARHDDVAIEPTQGFEAPPPETRRTASFMSGGVDALTLLRCNRLDFPLDHPGSIKDGIFIHGFDVGGYEELDDNLKNSETAVASLSTLEESAHLCLIPVWSNVRHLDDSDHLFFREFYGATMAFVAHMFSKRISTAMIASGSSVVDLGPIGSHPLLDANFSSADVSIRHEGIRLSRLEKVGVLSQWQEGLRTLRSCFDAFRPGDALNCGKCEKCIRTMTELLVYDKLNACSSYPLEDITPEILKGVEASPPTGPFRDRRERLAQGFVRMTMASVYYWRELVQPLREKGRDDLAEVIEGKVAEYDDSRTRIEEGRNWKGMLKRLDRKLLRGRLLELWRSVRPRDKGGS